MSLLDRNILDSLFLNIRLHGLNMKEGSIPAALLYRIQYKVMNTCNSRVLLKTTDRETTLFVTDMAKANVTISLSSFAPRCNFTQTPFSQSPLISYSPFYQLEST